MLSGFLHVEDRKQQPHSHATVLVYGQNHRSSETSRRMIKFAGNNIPSHKHGSRIPPAPECKRKWCVKGPCDQLP